MDEQDAHAAHVAYYDQLHAAAVEALQQSSAAFVLVLCDESGNCEVHGASFSPTPAESVSFLARGIQAISLAISERPLNSEPEDRL